MCHHMQVEVICLCVNVSLLHQNQLPEVTCTVAAGHCACCLPLSRCQLAFPILHVFFDDLLSLAAVTFLTAAYTQISLEPQKNTQDEIQVDIILNLSVHIGPYHCTHTPVCTQLSGFSRSIRYEFKEELATFTQYFPLLPFSSPSKCCIIPDSSLQTIPSCYFQH